MVIYLERGADLHMAQLMPLPFTVSCFSKIQIGFICLVPAHPGSPGQKAVKRVCVLQVEVNCEITVTRGRVLLLLYTTTAADSLSTMHDDGTMSCRHTSVNCRSKVGRIGNQN